MHLFPGGIIYPYIHKSAEEYGLPDHVLVPYIVANGEWFGAYSTHITVGLMESWGVSQDEMLRQAIRNTQYQIIPIEEYYKDSLYEEGAESATKETKYGWTSLDIVTNDSMGYGAAAIIPALDEIKNKYPEGYFILPATQNICVVGSALSLAFADVKDFLYNLCKRAVIQQESLGTRIYLTTWGHNK